jgi:hypothetical protein
MLSTEPGSASLRAGGSIVHRASCGSRLRGGRLLCAVALVEPLSLLDGELEGASTKGHCELIEEADLTKQDLPGSRGPLIEEPDLGSPFPTRQTWLRSEPERHISRMDKSGFAANLQRSGLIAIRRHSDLPCNTGRSKHSLSAGVHESMERSFLRPLWPLCAYEGDAHHRSVDETSLGVRRTTSWILLVGEGPREGTPFSQRWDYPSPTSSASCSFSVGTRRTLASRIRLERNCLNSASALLAAATTSLPLRATHFPSSPRSISDRCRGSTAPPRSLLVRTTSV